MKDALLWLPLRLVMVSASSGFPSPLLSLQWPTLSPPLGLCLSLSIQFKKLYWGWTQTVPIPKKDTELYNGEHAPGERASKGLLFEGFSLWLFPLPCKARLFTIKETVSQRKRCSVQSVRTVHDTQG